MGRLGRALAAMVVGSLTIVAGGQSASAGAMCDSTFHEVTGPAGTGSTYLNDVDAVSPTNAWAVGVEGGASGFSIHWNGSTWQDEAVPVIGTNDYLGAVAMAGPHDVWAVGQLVNSHGKNRTLVLHRTTGGWARVASPNGPTGSTGLYEIAVVSPTDIWASGTTGRDGSVRAFVLHWNGIKWKRITFPTVVAGNNFVEGMAAVGPNDVWVSIQYTAASGHERATTFHRTGTTWTRVNFPQGTTTDTEPRALLGLGPSSVWMAGFTEIGTSHTGLLMHWDGHHWVPFNAVDPTANVFFEALSAIGPHSVYVFGNYDDGPNTLTIAERFDGIKWTRVTTTNPASSNNNRLDGAAAASAGSLKRVFAVGSAEPSGQVPLIEESCP